MRNSVQLENDMYTLNVLIFNSKHQYIVPIAESLSSRVLKAKTHPKRAETKIA